VITTSHRPSAHPVSGVPWRRPAPFRDSAASKRADQESGPAGDGGYVDELLAIFPASGVVGDRKFVHANHLYGVAALTDNDGAVVERYRYDAYGQRIVLAGDGVTLRWGSSYGNQVGITGRYLDKETGLWYFRARYYSGSLGRFASRDPLGHVDGKGLYGTYYVPNKLDPFGLQCEPEFQAMITAMTIREIKLQSVSEWEQRLTRIQQEVNAYAAANSGLVNVGLLALLGTYAQAVAESRGEYSQASTAAAEAAAAYARCLRGETTPPPPISPASAMCAHNWNDSIQGSELLILNQLEHALCRARTAGCLSRCNVVCCSDKLASCQLLCEVIGVRCWIKYPYAYHNKAK